MLHINQQIGSVAVCLVCLTLEDKVMGLKFTEANDQHVFFVYLSSKRGARFIRLGEGWALFQFTSAVIIRAHSLDLHLLHLTGYNKYG